jgi:hypothetical protein
MVPRLFMIPLLVVTGGLAMMTGCVFVVFRCLEMVVSSLLRHRTLLLGELD